MKKILILLVVLAVAGGGFYYYQKSAKKAQAPADGNSAATQGTGLDKQQNTDTTDQTNQQEDNPATSTPAPAKQPQTSKPSTGTFSSGEEEMNPDVQVWKVGYDGSSFDPAVLDIKVGDVVIFKNNGSKPFWPASDPHPAHSGYPAFDAGEGIAAGGKFQFQFTKSGSFGFHDHLNPAAKGTINVTK